MQGSTIAAIATPPGAGGIAVVRLSGAESYTVAARVFRPANPAKKVEEAKGYTALFGHFVDREEAFDEGVALFFRAPHSYTGEDVVELSCHGGSAVARRLVEACLAAGAQPAAPGEYTRRAFLNGKLGLTQAEAVMDLIAADGRQGAALANAALGGALAKKINAQKAQLTALQAHLAAWVDFPEEDVPELDPAHLRTVLGGVREELDGLIRSYDAGAVLREGVDCAIVGRPNAGKSTLLNLLAEAAGIAALSAEDYRKMSLEFLQNERWRLFDELGKLGFRMWKPSANYVFFQAEQCPDLDRQLLPYGILLRHCDTYDGLDATYYRAAVRLPEENQYLLHCLRCILGEEGLLWQQNH